MSNDQNDNLDNMTGELAEPRPQPPKEQVEARIARLMEFFDANLERLQKKDFDIEMCEDEGRLLDVLAEFLEEALECGATMTELQDRARLLAKEAFNCGFTHQEVERLLTLRPNPFLTVNRDA